MVEHGTENAGVGGSNPPLGTTLLIRGGYKLKQGINNPCIDRYRPILLDKFPAAHSKRPQSTAFDGMIAPGNPGRDFSDALPPVRFVSRVTLGHFPRNPHELHPDANSNPANPYTVEMWSHSFSTINPGITKDGLAEQNPFTHSTIGRHFKNTGSCAGCFNGGLTDY